MQLRILHDTILILYHFAKEIMLSNRIFHVHRKRKWLINDGIERDRFEKSLNEVAVKHRTVLGSPNWLVKRREPSLNLSVRTHRYHYSRSPRQGSLWEGSVRRRERWAYSWWMRDRTRNGVAAPFCGPSTTAVSPTNSKLPSFLVVMKLPT